jgi:hypothetical protein
MKSAHLARAGRDELTEQSLTLVESSYSCGALAVGGLARIVGRTARKAGSTARKNHSASQRQAVGALAYRRGQRERLTLHLRRIRPWLVPTSICSGEFACNQGKGS